MKQTIKIGQKRIPLIKRVYWNLINYWAWFFPWKKVRVFFHRLKGVSIGKNVEIGYMVFLDNRRPELIVIGDNVTITSFSIVVAHDLSRRISHNEEIIGKVKISNGSFIGVNSTILPGITVGENCVIGAGSVVTKSTKPNTTYAGVPAEQLEF